MSVLIMNSKRPKNNIRFCSLHFSVLVFLSLEILVGCQDVGDIDQFANPTAAAQLANDVYNRIRNLTTLLTQDIGDRSAFCVKDPEVDWDRAFNFSGDLTFLASCIRQTKEDPTRRICTAAETKFYFDRYFKNPTNANILNPNKNCNLTSWVPGCESGWACSVGQNQEVDLQNSKNTPARTQDCQPCCEGFFCPRGLTCMIPCPLGSYCPHANLNDATGLCDPYLYQLPPGQPNHTCGGADIWADVRTSNNIFCSAGSYCPTTTQKLSCRRGNYCRMGSTLEQSCFKLTSCNSNTGYQDMHLYGAMIIACLCFLLLIIYNCSDQVLTTRERRQAKSREAAARYARENVKAHERWKAAKDAAMRHARRSQNQLSRTFSREKVQGVSEIDSDIRPQELPSFPPEERRNELRDSSQAMHQIDIDGDNDWSFNSETENKRVKRKMPKGKHRHTRSERFRFAYAQIEKEKTQLQEVKSLTFSGVVAMATNPEMKKRPLLEISFKDLTLTLKAKKKHLLRCVTGNIKPGRITAVMGPSGAGKTTFLSALAGKAVGCQISGSILINGMDVSIHSYKRIIGFVPQDDIVHGNLTVEENLWFSAKCRLSTDLSMADKVLIVERVIEGLGLQSIRNSVVGTVEKRGISGGQRKRVNVGLEMVMEPSVLFLDEPTSGLDSASSQLLLRALRRESLEGVNICMVVHQPSYALFKMFDDLILLAKGGLTVYHGPVKKAEEYFSDLGINVPERINPPDYFIDILEGMVTPSESSNVSCAELPVRWMLHKGYPVPADMQQNVSGSEEHSFAGDLWEDIRSNMQVRKDKIRLNFLNSKDLSNRKTPGILRQYRYYVGRVGKQRLREAKTQAIDYLILFLAGICLGSIANVSDQTFGTLGYTYTVIAVSLLCKIAALRSFTLDKLQYWRESSSGMSSLAYFLSKDTVDLFNIGIKPVVYLSMFYFFTSPRSSFVDNYIVMICLVYCVTGLAYTFAMFLEPSGAQLCSVILPVILTLVATQQRNNVALKIISQACYPKWALEAFVIANAEKYYGVWLITRCGILLKSGYDLRHWHLCISVLILYGVVGRVLAFIGMLTFQKK